MIDGVKNHEDDEDKQKYPTRVLYNLGGAIPPPEAGGGSSVNIQKSHITIGAACGIILLAIRFSFSTGNAVGVNATAITALTTQTQSLAVSIIKIQDDQRLQIDTERHLADEIAALQEQNRILFDSLKELQQNGRQH